MTTPLIETIARAMDATCGYAGDDNVRRAQATLTAITTAGYAIVPVEPTEVMVAAPAIEADEYYFSTQQRANDHVAHIYRAMITAALDSEKGE